jgi:hypothetical protein
MNHFTYYFQRTRHLCVYQYHYSKSSFLPPTLFFPYTTKLTLIDCSRSGISHLLDSRRFPKLEHIHYLSGHPGTYNIYERFPKSVKWFFPNRDYAFYNCMLEAGRGVKDNNIILANIYSKNNKNIVPSFDIHVPGYGRRDGLYYKEHMYQYFHHPQVLTNLSPKELIPDKGDESHYLNYIKRHENNPLNHYIQRTLEKDFFEHIMRDA